MLLVLLLNVRRLSRYRLGLVVAVAEYTMAASHAGMPPFVLDVSWAFYRL